MGRSRASRSFSSRNGEQRLLVVEIERQIFGDGIGKRRMLFAIDFVRSGAVEQLVAFFVRGDHFGGRYDRLRDRACRPRNFEYGFEARLVLKDLQNLKDATAFDGNIHPAVFILARDFDYRALQPTFATPPSRSRTIPNSDSVSTQWRINS